MEYEILGSHYPLGFYNTFSALEHGPMALQVFHGCYPSFIAPIDFRGVLPTICNTLENLFIIVNCLLPL
jgi:hypothetical protein